MKNLLIKKEKPLTYAALLAQHDYNLYIPYSSLLRTQEWLEKREEILKRDSHQCQIQNVENCCQGSCLQVHHLYYIIQKFSLKEKRFIKNLPWEYRDEALITVCNQCHQAIHEKEKIPLFQQIAPGKYAQKNFIACYRCKGVGYFPQYKNVEEGICFRCKGQRFEELR